MVKREELSMFVERRILATLRQPNELQSCLAYWAWVLPVNTPAAEYPIHRQVMWGVVVPNIHFEVCLYSSVVCPNPLIPSTDQIINQRLHVHTHIIPLGIQELSTTRIYFVVGRGRQGGRLRVIAKIGQQVYGAANIP